MASLRPSGPLVPIIAGIVCVISLMFLIGNLSNLDLGQGTQGSKDLVLQMEGVLLPILGILWLVLLVLILLTTQRKRVAGPKKVQGKPQSNFLLALFVIASILVLATAFGGNTLMPQGNGASDGGGDATGAPPDTSGTPPTLTSTAFPAVALVLVVAVVIAAVLVMRKGMTPAPVAVDVPAPSMDPMPSFSVTEAIEDLESHPDARGGILAAYGRMAAQLGQSGEDRALTPREFALKSGWRLKESSSSLRDLTALFEEARYSDHAMGEGERSRALAALRDIEAELGRKAG